MANRKGEEPRTWFRSQRVFRVDGDWFIHTREGIAVGPYSDRFSADVDAEMLRSLLVGASEAEAFRIINAFVDNGGNITTGAAAEAVRSSEVADLLRDDEEISFDRIRELS